MSGTVEKAFAVLELLATYDRPVRLAELSRELGMNKSTTYRMLETMANLGYIQQDEPNGRYMITMKMWQIGVQAFQRSDIRSWARPCLERIREKTNEAAVLAIVDGQTVVIVDKSASSQAIQTFSPLGSRSPLHCSSLGKAYLMVDTETKLEALKKPLQAFTANTITKIADLRACIAACAREGVATAVDEYREGVSGISAPAIGVDGRVHGIVGITIPTQRAQGATLELHKDVVRTEARELSRILGHA